MKKLMAKFRKKVNNAGLTLIEILVAMAILTIAIIPLMSGYIYSVRHNNMAKDMQQTSILASTMIENCKAFDVDTIESKVTSGNFIPNAKSSIVAKNDDNHYLYYFDDVKVYDGSNQIYDISMEIRNKGAESDLMYYEDMSAYNDAFFMADTTKSIGEPQYTMEQLEAMAYEHALNELKELIDLDSADKTPTGNPVNISIADIDYSLKNDTRYVVDSNDLFEITRTITLKVRRTAEGLETVDVICSFTYDFDSPFYYTIPDLDINDDDVPDEVSVASCDGEIDAWDGVTFRIYSNEKDKTNAKLDNIYMFYVPSYNNVGISFADDIINIDSDLGRGFTLYLMKQKRYGMSDAEITNADYAYNPGFTTNIVGDGTVTVYHNLTENLGDENVLVTWADPENPCLNFMDSVIKDDSKQLMYSVEVKVYSKEAYFDNGTSKGMATEPLASMDGTFLNW